MITVTINGHNFGIRDEKFNEYKFMRCVAEAQKNPVFTYDVIDEFVVGGADGIAKVIDPVSGNPSNEAMMDVITKLFNSAGEALKNSSGSQRLYENASRHSDLTFVGTSDSVSTTLKQDAYQFPTQPLAPQTCRNTER
ncbi:MAG: hypothetical protein FWF33_00480 [Clostridiales bacterium]|nr:hypothetical protein [Clostridiales bacterium]